MTSLDPSLLVNVTGGADPSTADQKTCADHVLGGTAAGAVGGSEMARGLPARIVLGIAGALTTGYAAYKVTPACHR